MHALIVIFMVALVVVAPLVYSIYRRAQGYRDRKDKDLTLEEFRAKYGERWVEEYRKIYRPKPKEK